MSTIEVRKDAQEYIREHSTDYFKPDKSGKGYICPICESGSGPNGTGITENPKSKGHFTCWAGCFENADIFEIIGKRFGLTDFNEQFKRACEIFNVDTSNTWSSGNKNQNRALDVADYTNFFDLAAQNLSMTDYHRGISIETLKKFNVGFMPEWNHPKIPNAPKSPRLIIPVWEGGYLARDTRPNLTDEQKKYAKQRVGTVNLFNIAALKQTNQPVYVVEGEIDAMSIIDVGGQAIGLASTSNYKKLIEAVKSDVPRVPLILSLDRDSAGQKANSELKKGLQQAGFTLYREHNLPKDYKDANEFLVANRESFAEWVKAGEVGVNEKTREEFDCEAVSYRLNNFLSEIEKNREGRAISTGFLNLDEIFDGGFYPGLYTIGANSSTGKTTLCLQIGDNIAQSGQGVLFFSLEMSANEVMAKTLSRMTAIKNRENAKTTRGILLGKYNSVEKRIISQSIREYAEWGNNFHITEGVGDVGIFRVKEKVEQYMNFNNGNPPVVIIDYLQVLAAYDERMTDKQNVDKNILELKRLSRDYQIPIIGISSFNRENYKSPVGMASFKESGAIEYSSDVLLGLQYYGWDYQEGEKEGNRLERLRKISEVMDKASKAGEPLKMQLKILKNRNGRRGDVTFNFYPKFNYFLPC